MCEVSKREGWCARQLYQQCLRRQHELAELPRGASHLKLQYTWALKWPPWESWRGWFILTALAALVWVAFIIDKETLAPGCLQGTCGLLFRLAVSSPAVDASYIYTCVFMHRDPIAASR